MGSDMHYVIQAVMERSHYGLIAALKKARDTLQNSNITGKHTALIAEIDQALANARVA